MSQISKETFKRLYIDESLTLKAIAKKFKISHNKLKYLKAKYHLTNIKPHYNLGKRKHDYIDLDRFSTIQDKDAAYILGYLAWAGSKTAQEDTYIISARESQHPCIYKIMEALGLKEDNSFRHTMNGKYNHYALHLSKKGLDKFISKWYYGDSHIKPFKFPPSMDKKYLPDYLRGYLDRHTAILHQSKGYCDFYISAPYKSFAEQLQKTLESFAINNWVKSRPQLNGKISYGIYISARSFGDLYRLLFSKKDSGGTHLEQNLLREAYRVEYTKKNAIYSKAA